MSLITLTFSGSATSTADEIGHGRIKVLKTDKFYGSDGICVIGRLLEGAVSKSMKICGRENCLVTTVESKYGDNTCTHEGAQVLLMIDGISKDDFSAGQEITLEKERVEIVRPKGKLIIA